MSPESIQDPENVDARSDIYAVGAVGYYLLTGQDVFTGRSALYVMQKHLADEVIPPSDRLAESVDHDISEVILRCLQKEPGARPQTVTELAEALGNCDSLR